METGVYYNVPVRFQITGKGDKNMYSFFLSSLAVGSTVLVVWSIIWYVLTIVGDWKIFEKAGEKPWKSIIPFLNTYTEFKLSWKGVYGIVMIICNLITTNYARISNTYRVYMAQSAEGSTVVAVPSAPSGLFTAIAVCALVVTIVLNVLKAKNLAAAFGKNTGFAMGLFFFEPIFRIVLGLGKDKYVGPMGNPNQPKTFR